MIARAFTAVATVASAGVDRPHAHLQCPTPVDAEGCPPAAKGNHTYCAKMHYDQQVMEHEDIQANEWHHDDHYGFFGMGNATVLSTVSSGITGTTLTFCERTAAVVHGEGSFPVKGPITQHFEMAGAVFTHASTNTRAQRMEYYDGRVDFNQTAVAFESRSTFDHQGTYVVMPLGEKPADPQGPSSTRTRGAGTAFVTAYYKDDQTEFSFSMDSIFHLVLTVNQTFLPHGGIQQSMTHAVMISGVMDQDDIFMDETMDQRIYQVVHTYTDAPEVATARPPAFPVELVSNALLHKVATAKNITLRLPSPSTRESAPQSIVA